MKTSNLSLLQVYQIIFLAFFSYFLINPQVAFGQSQTEETGIGHPFIFVENCIDT